MVTLGTKSELLKLMKQARKAKFDLAQKLKIDVSQLTRASCLAIKVIAPGLHTWINQWQRQCADDSQFIFLEMPANNLINSYSTLDPEKKFVFNAHKSLSSILKFLQARDP